MTVRGGASEPPTTMIRASLCMAMGCCGRGCCCKGWDGFYTANSERWWRV